jgi:hypothetical protein
MTKLFILAAMALAFAVPASATKSCCTTKTVTTTHDNQGSHTDRLKGKNPIIANWINPAAFNNLMLGSGPDSFTRTTSRTVTTCSPHEGRRK